MFMRHLYLIRHGEYQRNSSPDGGPSEDGGLTELGKEQAARTTQAVKHLPIRVVHSSNMRRALETATIIGNELNVKVEASPDLREAIPVIPPLFADAFARMFPNLSDETVEADRRRADDAFDRLFQPPGGKELYELVVCHGNLIQYFTCRVLSAPLENWVMLDTNNCGITHVTVGDSGRMKLVASNEIGHLPPAMRTI